MIQINVPGFCELRLENLVLDYNGTLALDGQLYPGVKELLLQLGELLAIHIITADTFGKARQQIHGIPCQLVLAEGEKQDTLKQELVRRLGSSKTVAIGNGRNDRLMLQEAILGIAVIQEEGASPETLQHADIVCRSMIEALQLLAHPKRIVATLRNA